MSRTSTKSFSSYQRIGDLNSKKIENNTKERRQNHKCVNDESDSEPTEYTNLLTTSSTATKMTSNPSYDFNTSTGYHSLKGYQGPTKKTTLTIFFLVLLVVAICGLSLYAVIETQRIRNEISLIARDCCKNPIYKIPDENTPGNENKSQEIVKIQKASNQINISAHVTSPVFKVTNETAEKTAEIVDWKKTNHGDSFCSVIGQRNGRLIIPLDGNYFVYSQIQFLNNPHGDERIAGFSYVQLAHFVYKYNIVYPNDGNKLLMRRSSTAHWGQERNVDHHASYLGGMFRLRAGDELLVKLTDNGVHGDPKSTFFGVFLIGQLYNE